MYESSPDKAYRSSPNVSIQQTRRPRSTIMREIVDRMKTKYTTIQNPTNWTDVSTEEIIIENEVEQILSNRFIKPKDLSRLEQNIEKRLGYSTSRTSQHHGTQRGERGSQSQQKLVNPWSASKHKSRIESLDYGSNHKTLIQPSRNNSKSVRESYLGQKNHSMGKLLPSPTRKLTWADVVAKQKEEFLNQQKNQKYEKSEQKKQLRNFLDEQV